MGDDTGGTEITQGNVSRRLRETGRIQSKIKGFNIN
jgi:hypothetical protein